LTEGESILRPRGKGSELQPTTSKPYTKGALGCLNQGVRRGLEPGKKNMTQHLLGAEKKLKTRQKVQEEVNRKGPGDKKVLRCTARGSREKKR